MPDPKSQVRLVEEAPSGEATIDAGLIASVAVELEARIGSASLTVAQLSALKKGDSVPLDAALNQDVELRLNGQVVARGELVAVGTRFGVRIVDIAR